MILTGMEGVHGTYRHGGEYLDEYMVLTGVEGVHDT